MIEFKIDCTFCRGQRNTFNLLRPWNLINFSDILKADEKLYNRNMLSTNLPNELVQECLTNFMAMSMPLQSVYFSEGVKFLHGCRGFRAQLLD